MHDFRIQILILFMLSSCSWVNQRQQQTHVLDYDRGEWPHWLDLDKDCENTRAEILIASSLIQVKGKCIVKSGSWYGRYVAEGFTQANKLDIDHIVPLKHAYDHGAEKWDRNKRARFANDHFNLIAVDRSANRRKGAKAPHEWMPPNEEFGCIYVQRWMSIKALYNLKIGRDERKFLRKYVKECLLYETQFRGK
jgi:hypothetical protein